ncbi:hypothetical protein GCM10009775_04540 [Microbacterium aoyamense]|uniref:Uncharacterized protein n=2 Tax=Microbacterium aoyamense TaxID=344166 RepID=A0ABN2PBN0_9MICO
MAKRVVLHYGGEKFELPANQADALEGIEDETGTISLNAGGGKWITFVAGPGIPALLETWDEEEVDVLDTIR